MNKLASLAAKSGKKPNIMIFLLDDVGWGDPGFNDDGVADGNATPNMDKLVTAALEASSHAPIWLSKLVSVAFTSASISGPVAASPREAAATVASMVIRIKESARNVVICQTSQCRGAGKQRDRTSPPVGDAEG
jgi:hypothetical protein